MSDRKFILGGGVTGLAAGVSSGLPVFEASDRPGGICSSYYVKPGSTERLPSSPANDEAYRFEIGGGHWIFGGDPTIHQFINHNAPVGTYYRKSGVWFPTTDKYVPYPIQNNLRYLDGPVVSQILSEIVSAQPPAARTMDDWLQTCFGPTLCKLFFEPFHNLYTAGLYREIAPQDAYKSPVNPAAVVRGAFEQPDHVGYNVSYVYPKNGLNVLAQSMANRCDIHYGHKVTKIDLASKTVHFDKGQEVDFDDLICTLPLNRTLELCDLSLDMPADPHTSVLVLNVGGTKGDKCPDDHWIYLPNSDSGFHRVGFYSNVDPSFLPKSSRETGDRVSIYVERAYSGTGKPSAEETARYSKQVTDELIHWGMLRDVEVADATWIDVAYTWKAPGSKWREEALKALESHGIYMVGRYARWVFQGIADSIRDGFMAGSSFRPE
ncbi:protoporphyrinogen oxidase-like protein [bacterium]|nr:protoporphyrinogen oxidase-like protein [bacterium]